MRLGTLHCNLGMHISWLVLVWSRFDACKNCQLYEKGAHSGCITLPRRNIGIHRDTLCIMLHLGNSNINRRR